MAKVYIANTALILEDEAGKQFRVEAGEAIELTPEQYESVARSCDADGNYRRRAGCTTGRNSRENAV